MGPVVFLLFGSQSDVLRHWGLMRRCQGRSSGLIGITGSSGGTTVEDDCSGHKTIQIPLTFNALRFYKSKNTRSGEGHRAEQGHHILTTYGQNALHTLNENIIATGYTDYRSSRITLAPSQADSRSSIDASLKVHREESTIRFCAPSVHTLSIDDSPIRTTFGPSAPPAEPVDKALCPPTPPAPPPLVLAPSTAPNMGNKC